MNTGINRIRLEFKDVNGPCTVISALSINRIRLEFKVPASIDFVPRSRIVLIESDWNLKLKVTSITVDQGVVLIESDWNLKLM